MGPHNPPLERHTARHVVFSETTVVVDLPIPLEHQMSKRKPAIASKRAQGPEIKARAQKNRQAIVRSPKDKPLRSGAAGPTESLLKVHDDSKQKAPIVENRVAGSQRGLSQAMRDKTPKKGFDFSLVTTNVQAHQTALLKMVQANMQFAFEFGQRLATTRSPFEFFAVISEFTSRQFEIFRQYSKQLAASPFWRIEASRELAALPGR
jgi:hypothetical protein